MKSINQIIQKSNIYIYIYIYIYISLLFSYSTSPLFHFSFIGSLLGLVLLYYIYNSIARASIISRVQHFSFSIAGNFAEKEHGQNIRHSFEKGNLIGVRSYRYKTALTRFQQQLRAIGGIPAYAGKTALFNSSIWKFDNLKMIFSQKKEHFNKKTIQQFNKRTTNSKNTGSIGNNTLTAPSTSAVVYHCCSTNYSNLILSVSYHDKLPKLFFSQQEKQFNFKKHVIPLKKGIPLARATTNTSQHFLFSTAVASYCWDSVYFFQKLRNDGVGQFENNFFAGKRTFNFKNFQLSTQNSSTATKRTLN